MAATSPSAPSSSAPSAAPRTAAPRKRAPSAKALERRTTILDAAERVFAQAGYDAATMRDVAAEAGVPLGLVHHHGGGKAALFEQVITRRGNDLARHRLAALETVRARGGASDTGQEEAGNGRGPDAAGLLRCFFEPLISRARVDAQWLAYARLVALVSADARWRDLTAAVFDPTAQDFLQEMARLFPRASASARAEALVYAVSALLAFLTTGWRVAALAQEPVETRQIPLAPEGLIAFCAAGMTARLGG
ncbi:TetR/AcrR family transcriptional regulator [Pseudooceanicola aestuarii]|uniref:TetR/AcrR family transcriptional regulator n=1 Tax=Pseudooceanicola aestuarii TaxID=2697319 RepID=UPI0013D6824D|nr:TetR/AcrR family transcriptional regulator [Pseudooceanicola aestuarii]